MLHREPLLVMLLMLIDEIPWPQAAAQRRRGRQNEHILAPLGGTWQPAKVRGRLKMEGWGANLGFPGLVLDPGGRRSRGWSSLARSWRISGPS